MKKIASAFILFVAAAVSQAQTIVPVIWPFSPSSTSATMLRDIINEANQNQKKYHFVFENKPGAGGALAVQHAASLKQPAILAHSSSYFIRPYMFKEGAYDVDQNKMLNVFCTEQPLAMISKKYKTLDEVHQQSKLSVGLLPGSITQLVVSEYKKHNHKSDIVNVGYKGTVEITAAVLGNHLDLGIVFLSDIVHKDLNVLGISGRHSYPGSNTFRSQGVKELDELTIGFFLLANKQLDPSTLKEFDTIMSNAVIAEKPKDMCRRDFGLPKNITGDQAQIYFDNTHQYWKQIVEKTVK